MICSTFNRIQFCNSCAKYTDRMIPAATNMSGNAAQEGNLGMQPYGRQLKSPPLPCRGNWSGNGWWRYWKRAVQIDRILECDNVFSAQKWYSSVDNPSRLFRCSIKREKKAPQVLPQVAAICFVMYQEYQFQNGV